MDLTIFTMKSHLFLIVLYFEGSKRTQDRRGYIFYLNYKTYGVDINN